MILKLRLCIYIISISLLLSCNENETSADNESGQEITDTELPSIELSENNIDSIKAHLCKYWILSNMTINGFPIVGSENYIQFNNDYSYNATGVEEISGTWQLSEDGKTIIATETTPKNQTLQYNILKLNSKTLHYKIGNSEPNVEVTYKAKKY
jgi:hypothetical protein